MSAGDLITIGMTAQNASHLARLRERTEQVSERPVQQFWTSTHETLEDRCQRLRQEWVDAEFLLFSQGYEGKANIDKVAGVVGPFVLLHGEHCRRACQGHGRYRVIGDYPLVGCIPYWLDGFYGSGSGGLHDSL